MRKRRQIEIFSLSFLDLISGALGAVIILYVAIPKTKPVEVPKEDNVKEQMKVELVSTKKNLYNLEEELKSLRKELEEAREKLAGIPSPVEKAPEDPVVGGIDADIGFKFKGKSIVFIIDTSASMREEERMTQVKAGLKMLLQSLPGAFKIEVVQFPLGQRAPFRSMWGTTKEFQGLNRFDTFDFIYSLRPSGGTPTRDTLMFVLKNYEDITDIVLLTDGAPSYHNSNKKDDIYEILRLVRENNKTKVQINTIGVGSEFLNDKTSEQYKFLSLLSSENNGFFVGF